MTQSSKSPIGLFADELKAKFDVIVKKPNNIDKVCLCAFVDGVKDYYKIVRIASENHSSRAVQSDLLKTVILAERDKYLASPHFYQNTFTDGSHTYSVCPFGNGFIIVFASAEPDADLFSDSTRLHFDALKPEIKKLNEML